MTEMIVTGLLLTYMWCTVGPVHDGRCDDGEPPHQLEMRVLNGTGDPPADIFTSNFDNANINALIVVKKDGVEIVNIPVPDALSKDDLKRLLTGFGR